MQPTPTDAATPLPAPFRYFSVRAEDPTRVVASYLTAAVEMIDAQFGGGHAAKFPSLVTACVQAMASLPPAFMSDEAALVQPESPAAKKKPGAVKP